LVNEEWYPGYVEHNGSYYFCNKYAGNPQLFEGMRVRIRK
jgi:hypothetical protein